MSPNRRTSRFAHIRRALCASEAFTTWTDARVGEEGLGTDEFVDARDGRGGGDAGGESEIVDALENEIARPGTA